MATVGVSVEHGLQASVEIMPLLAAHVGIWFVELPGSISYYIDKLMNERVRGIFQKRVLNYGLQRQVAVAGSYGLVSCVVGHWIVVPHFSH